MSVSSSTFSFDHPESQFSTTLIFSRDEPCHCTIALNEKPLYEVKSRREIVKKLGHNDLLITTDIFGPTGELVASVKWRGGRSDTITWPRRGLEDAKLSTWLKRNPMPWSRGATFQDAQDRIYKWDTRGLRNQFRLIDDDRTPIAYFERAMPYVNLQPGYNYNPVPTPSRLLLSQRADLIREDVVLSFLIVERYSRRTDISVENWADAQAAGASYMGALAL